MMASYAAGAALVPRLLALEPDVQPARFSLEADSCTIGRSALCDVVVPRETVSRLHARIVRDGPRFRLEDAGSANGTFVNGERLTAPHLLADRDQIGLGSPAPLLSYADPDPTVVATSRLRFDERALRFSLGGQPVELTPNEFRLLRFLHQHAGQVRTREQCAEAIWGPDYAPGWESDALDRVVSNLRGKLRRLDAGELIRTRPGLGYELIP
jgi:DNA-binding response OmpR family regulator